MLRYKIYPHNSPVLLLLFFFLFVLDSKLSCPVSAVSLYAPHLRLTSSEGDGEEKEREEVEGGRKAEREGELERVRGKDTP